MRSLFPLRQDIDHVLCEGTSVTILYSRTSGAASSAVRMRSLSPMRHSSMSAPQAPQRKRKAFRASQDRDALILKELLLFIRRKALLSAVVSKPPAADDTPCSPGRVSTASSVCSSSAFDSEDDDNYGIDEVSAVGNSKKKVMDSSSSRRRGRSGVWGGRGAGFLPSTGGWKGRIRRRNSVSL